MIPLLSPQAMARADRAAIESGVSETTLMERAGRAVARAAIRGAGGRYGRRAVVICGKGNNGGDGLVAARVLHRDGMGVTCAAVGDPAAGSGGARASVERLAAAGLSCDPFDAVVLEGADVVVDAIFGTGFRGRAEGLAAKAIDAVNAHPAPVVAVDIPSGVDGATGAAPGPAVRADATVAMGAIKIGAAVGAGADLAGEIEVADIGIAVTGADGWMVERADVAAVLPTRSRRAHKRSGGAVALLAGGRGMSGAAVLAARAAVRAGAGYATLGCSAEVEAVVSALVPEVLTVTAARGPALGPDALDLVAPVVERAGALALGPGLGRGPAQRALVDRVLAEVDVPVVVDADGLNVLASDPSPLQRRSAATVITPHPGEMARLMGTSPADVEEDRLQAAAAAAERFGCVVALKGWRTVVAAPGFAPVVDPAGGPVLASAGTGDVLTGIVAALLAAGVEPFPAAWAGVYVHGTAGALAAAGRDRGIVAWDVAESLPDAVAACRAGP